MAQSPLILGMGELLWDRLPSGKKIGGAPANVVYHTSCLGATGYIISAVGNDKLGEELLSATAKTSLNTAIEKVDYPTGLVHVVLSDGMPEYNIVENVAWDYIPLTDNALKLVKKADAICYGTLACRNNVSHNTILTLLKHANPSSYRLYDINLRASYYSKQLIRELISYSNIFKISNNEATVLKSIFDLDMSDDSFCKLILEKYHLQYLLYTYGNLNSKIYTQTETSTLKTPPIKINDTVGAGDAFAGAFLYYTLLGFSLEESHRMAVNIAAYVCTQSGAWSKYPKKIPNYI